MKKIYQPSARGEEPLYYGHVIEPEWLEQLDIIRGLLNDLRHVNEFDDSHRLARIRHLGALCKMFSARANVTKGFWEDSLDELFHIDKYVKAEEQRLLEKSAEKVENEQESEEEESVGEVES